MKLQHFVQKFLTYEAEVRLLNVNFHFLTNVCTVQKHSSSFIFDLSYAFHLET